MYMYVLNKDSGQLLNRYTCILLTWREGGREGGGGGEEEEVWWWGHFAGTSQ